MATTAPMEIAEETVEATPADIASASLARHDAARGRTSREPLTDDEVRQFRARIELNAKHGGLSTSFTTTLLAAIADELVAHRAVAALRAADVRAAAARDVRPIARLQLWPAPSPHDRTDVGRSLADSYTLATTLGYDVEPRFDYQDGELHLVLTASRRQEG